MRRSIRRRAIISTTWPSRTATRRSRRRCKNTTRTSNGTSNKEIVIDTNGSAGTTATAEPAAKAAARPQGRPRAAHGGRHRARVRGRRARRRRRGQRVRGLLQRDSRRVRRDRPVRRPARGRRPRAGDPRRFLRARRGVAPPEEPKTVRTRSCFLSARVGEGHRAAADAVRARLAARGMRGEVVDSYRYAASLFSKVVSDGYIGMVRTIPQLYGFIYDRAERATAAGGFRVWASEFTARNIARAHRAAAAERRRLHPRVSVRRDGGVQAAVRSVDRR